MAWPKKQAGKKVKATTTSRRAPVKPVIDSPDPVEMEKTEPKSLTSPEPSTSEISSAPDNTISKRQKRIRAMRKGRPDIGLAGRKKGTLSHAMYNKLEDQGLSPRWGNDWPGRIEELLELGYCFVQEDGSCVPLANNDLTTNVNQGSLIRQSCGTHPDGTPMYRYLMAQDKEILEEDRANSRQPLKEQAELLKKGFDPIATDDNRYGGIKVETNR